MNNPLGANSTPLNENDESLPADRMAVLFFVMLVTAAGNTAMQSVMPSIGTKLGVPDFWVTLAYSWSAILWVTMAPRWARMSDKRGRKALMHIGMLGFISSMGFCGLTLWFGFNGYLTAVGTFIIFAMFRSLYGGFGSAAPPAVQAYVASRTPRAKRTKAMSLIASSFGLGTVVGPAIAPYLMVPAIGLASPLIMFAFIGVVVILALRFRLPNDDPRFMAQGVVTAEPYSSGPPGATLFSAEETPGERLKWLDKRIRPWLAAGLIGGHAQAIMLGLAGFLVLDRLGLRDTPELAFEPTGIVLMSGAVATLLAQWGLIPILHLGPRASILIGTAIAGTGCTIVGLASGLHGLTIGFAIASLGFGLFRPGFTAGASLAVRRSEQGAIAGMVASTNGAAYIVAPALGVFLYNVYAPTPFIIIGTLCAFLMGWGFKTLKVSEYDEAPAKEASP